MDIKSLNKSLILCGLTTVAAMASDLSAEQIENCCDWNPCCFDYGLNPPPTCPTACGCTWFGEIEYLYWKPHVENAHAAEVITADYIDFSPSVNTRTISKSEMKDFNYEWDSGFRVGLGIGLPCDKWGISLKWSHYNTDSTFSSKGFSTSQQQDILVDVKMPFPSFINSQAFVILGSALQMGSVDSHWDFQFNQVDLDLFRNYYVGCSLSIKPYVGLRALFLKNTVDSFALYEGLTNTQDPDQFTKISADQHLRSDFKSVGLRAGAESFYELMCGLGVYGNIGASILYSCYELEHKALVTFVEDGGSTLTNNHESPYCFETLRLMTDLSLGIEWRETINCNQSMVFVKAGWEHHLIVEGSQFQTLNSALSTSLFPPTSSINDGDISLYGFVFSVGISF